MAETGFPPGPRPLIGFHILNDFNDRPLSFMEEMRATYGDVIYFKALGRRLYLFNDPESVHQILVARQQSFHKGVVVQSIKEVIGEGLFSSEDNLHLRQRRMIQPMFHRQRIGTYADTMVRLAEQVTNGWQDGVTLDIHAEITRLTLLIVTKTLFDTDVESDADQLSQVVATLVTTFTRTIAPQAALLMRLPLPSTRRILDARKRLVASIDALIAQHRSAGDRGDLLSMLIAARDEEDEDRRMSDKQVRDEALTIFIAGHETTANALTWTLYLLSQNPTVASRLRNEIDNVLAGRYPIYADIESLPYARMVLSEAMRIYPPVWVITRLAVQDVEIGAYRVPKDSSVLLSPWMTHHDERYYPEPLKFDPDRWTPANAATRPKMAYFPFGGGARVCIGEPFAWMEGILLLAIIVQKWDMCLEPGFSVELLPEITLRPKYGMRMTLKRR